ncbi:MAG: hypothetical protein P4L96_09435, partial [Rhodoferax sp.]|nr:hypothetical protein [Rhodoferax sp.]
DSVQRTLNAVRVDKWKKGSIRDEANQNISEILRDVQVNLPPLVRDADAGPATLSKLLPVSRNVSALYDVLLRVVEASRVVGPDDQVQQLQQALATLGNARLALADRMQGSAETLEKQVADLRATIQQQAAQRQTTLVPVALPCVTPPAHRTARKPAAKKPSPATTTPSTAKPNTTNANQQNSH